MLLGEPGLWLAGDDEVEDRIVDLPGTVLDVSVEVDDVAGVAALLPGLQFGCERCDVDGLLPDYSPGNVAVRRSEAVVSLCRLRRAHLVLACIERLRPLVPEAVFKRGVDGTVDEFPWVVVAAEDVVPEPLVGVEIDVRQLAFSFGLLSIDRSSGLETPNPVLGSGWYSCGSRALSSPSSTNHSATAQRRVRSTMVRASDSPSTAVTPSSTSRSRIFSRPSPSGRFRVPCSRTNCTGSSWPFSTIFVWRPWSDGRPPSPSSSS